MGSRCYMVDGYDGLWNDKDPTAKPNGDRNVGAMIWRYHQLDKRDKTPRPMPHLGVMTPAGLVCLDCPESDPPHGYWTRTGEPPDVTVTPSLNVNNEEWHGWLKDGILTP